MKLKTRKQLIKEGKPLIEFSKDGKKSTQLFLTEQGCQIRTNELIKAGYEVKRIQ